MVAGSTDTSQIKCQPSINEPWLVRGDYVSSQTPTWNNSRGYYWWHVDAAWGCSSAQMRLNEATRNGKNEEKSSNHWVRSTFGRDEQLIGMLNQKLLRIETNVQNMGQSLPRKESGSDWYWLIMNLSFGLLSLPSRVKRNVKSLN